MINQEKYLNIYFHEQSNPENVFNGIRNSFTDIFWEFSMDINSVFLLM